jgi:hypothetical protein
MTTRRQLLGGAAVLALAWPGWRTAVGADLAVAWTASAICSSSRRSAST